jgi:cold shock CspA family protein
MTSFSVGSPKFNLFGVEIEVNLNVNVFVYPRYDQLSLEPSLPPTLTLATSEYQQIEDQRQSHQLPLLPLPEQSLILIDGHQAGRVKWYDDEFGLGLIEPIGTTDEVFVFSDIVERAGLRTLNDGQTVVYDLVGDCAENLTTH